VVTKPALKRRRFTVDEYHRMGRAGILHEDDRVELIEGEIVEMAPIGDRHAACVNDLNEAFLTRLAGRAIVSVQNPVRLSSGSEPQPDLLILRPRADRYRHGLPTPDDVLLLVEVSDTTLAYDRGIKLRLYALAGIPEVWIWDLKRRRVLVFRGPDGAAYRETRVVTSGSVSPAAFPDLGIRLDDILGEA
jgi:Uma2 family endonuclease